MRYKLEIDSDARKECYDMLCELMRGAHHIHAHVTKCGLNGIQVNLSHGSWATFDGNLLTKLVILAHDKCIRAEIAPSGPGRIKLMLHKRQGRDGRMFERHPNLDTAIESIRPAGDA